jgi:hypothetical protein
MLTSDVRMSEGPQLVTSDVGRINYLKLLTSDVRMKKGPQLLNSDVRKSNAP